MSKSVGNTQASPDPEFNDHLKQIGPRIDPDGQEFRDELTVRGSVGAVHGIDAELREQERQVEEDTVAVLEALRNLDGGENVKWRISRVGSEDQSFDGFLETWPNSKMTLERIRDHFGGGTYYLKGFRNGKYWVHKSVTIAGDAIRKPGAQGKTELADRQSSDINSLLAQIDARDERRRREDEERRRREEEKEERRRQERKDMMIALGPAALAAIGQIFGTSRGPDLAALITAMKGPDPFTMMTQLQALQQNQQQSPDLMLKLLPMLIDKIGDSGGGDSGWMDVVKEMVKSAGPTVGALIENSVKAAQVNAGAQPSTPGMSLSVAATPISNPMGMPLTGSPTPPREAPLIVVPESRRPRERSRRVPVNSSADLQAMGPTAVVNTVGSPSDSGGDMSFLKLLPHLPWLREQLARLGAAAVRAKDPELYAAMFLEEMPDAVDIQMVGQLLASEDWFQKLCQLDQRLNRPDIADWFTVLRGHLLNSIQAELHAHVAQHSAPQSAPAGGRAQTQVYVRGPGTASGNITEGSSVSAPVASSAPARATGEVDRPQGLPSLTGE